MRGVQSQQIGLAYKNVIKDILGNTEISEERKTVFLELFKKDLTRRILRVNVIVYFDTFRNIITLLREKNMSKQTKEVRAQDRGRVVAAFKALSNENRMAIFEQIRAGHGRGQFNADNRLAVCAVAEKFNISLSTISHHIKELRAAGLVRCEREGQSIL
jgi:DNA-binding transcriptional ArsR family regulator